MLDEEIFQIWYSTIYNYNFKIANFKTAYAFTTPLPLRKLQLTKTIAPLRNRVRVKMQIHDSCLFTSRPGDTAALDIVDSIMNNTLIINNRPLHIPHDRGGQGVYWSDLK